jgi:phosphate transport system substrate-binding protein
MDFRYIFCTLLVLILHDASADIEKLRIHGSNTLGAELIPEMAFNWLHDRGYSSVTLEKHKEAATLHGKSSEGTDIEISIKSEGSSTGFKGLLNRVADIGMSSRKIKKKEISALSSVGDMTSSECEIIVALDGIAIIVHPDNPLQQLSKSQLREIFAGDIKDWQEVGAPPGAIHLYARDRNSGTYQVFNSLVMGKQATLSANVKRYADNAELSTEVSHDTLGIGFVGLPFVLESKALAVSDGEAPAIAPSRFSVATEDYALSRRLYVYAPPADKASRLALDFISYMESDNAQNLIDKVGFITQKVFLSTEETPVAYPEAMSELIDGAARLSVNMRFSERTVFLDNKAKRDADRVLNYLATNGRLQDGIMLFGFAENKPDGAHYTSINRSVRRADQVARYLSEKGVKVIASRGYGGTAPVASNLTDLGQRKNRRVELWIK